MIIRFCISNFTHPKIMWDNSRSSLLSHVMLSTYWIPLHTLWSSSDLVSPPRPHASPLSLNSCVDNVYLFRGWYKINWLSHGEKTNRGRKIHQRGTKLFLITLITFVTVTQTFFIVIYDKFGEKRENNRVLLL